jgi:hypothetical protein
VLDKSFRVATFFIEGLSFKPLAFLGCLFFIEGLSFEPTNEGCNNAPSFVALRFGVASFFIRDLSFEPLAFWGCLFFHRRSFFSALYVLRLSLFSSKVFLLSPIHFGVASFFIGYPSFKPMNECYNNAPSFVALAYLAQQLLSNIELALLAISTMVINILGKEAYITALGLHRLYLVKNLTPSRASPMRKRVQALRK